MGTVTLGNSLELASEVEDVKILSYTFNPRNRSHKISSAYGPEYIICKRMSIASLPLII